MRLVVYSEVHGRTYCRDTLNKLLIRGLINILNSSVKIKATRNEV
jgi:hypothetical protein